MLDTKGAAKPGEYWNMFGSVEVLEKYLSTLRFFSDVLFQP